MGRRTVVPALAAALLMAAAPVGPPVLAAGASKATPAIDPAAVQAARGMGAYLRSLRSFEIVSSAKLEEVDDAGQKVVTAMNTAYKVRRPDGFVIDMTTDEKARRFIYDGRSFTVTAPRVGYFATVSAPATIAQTVDLIYEAYGVVLPLADLFYWGDGAQPTDLLKSARRVGAATVDGVQTDHYAFAGPDFAWEVWIQRGAAPLPRKMRITTLDDPAKPTFTANLTWTPSAHFAPDAFTFKPAESAKPIAMARVDQ